MAESWQNLSVAADRSGYPRKKNLFFFSFFFGWVEWLVSNQNCSLTGEFQLSRTPGIHNITRVINNKPCACPQSGRATLDLVQLCVYAGVCMCFFIEVELFRVFSSPLSKNDLLRYTSEVLRHCVVSRCFCKDLVSLQTLLSASLLSWCHPGSPLDQPGATQVHAFSIQGVRYTGIHVPVFSLSKDLIPRPILVWGICQQCCYTSAGWMSVLSPISLPM